MYIVTFMLTINARHNSQTKFGGVIISRESKRGSVKQGVKLYYNVIEIYIYTDEVS
jgi:hypothetical protein